MYKALTPRGIRIPNGFAITASAYRHSVRSAGLDARITALLEGLDTANVAQLRERGAGIRAAFIEAELPADLRERIIEAYKWLSGGDPTGVDIAVRSSTTAEDPPDASFAGRQESYLNVRGRAAPSSCTHYVARTTYSAMRCVKLRHLSVVPRQVVQPGSPWKLRVSKPSVTRRPDEDPC